MVRVLWLQVQSKNEQGVEFSPAELIVQVEMMHMLVKILECLTHALDANSGVHMGRSVNMEA